MYPSMMTPQRSLEISQPSTRESESEHKSVNAADAESSKAMQSTSIHGSERLPSQSTSSAPRKGADMPLEPSGKPQASSSENHAPADSLSAS